MKAAADSGTENDPLDSRLRRHLTATRWAMTFERLWPAIWPAVAILGFYITFSLFDPWPYFPFPIHLLALAGCLGSALLLLRRAVRAVDWPSQNEVRRRLELEAKLEHRPLDMTDDEAVTAAGPLGRALWALHRKRARESLKAVRAQLPRAGLQYRDPRAIRALLLMALLVALADAGSDWGRRLEAAFLPRFGEPAGGLSAQAWLTPPEYTGLLPQTLLSPDNQVQDGPVDGPDLVVPVGSILSARVEGSWRTPVLKLAGKREKFEKNGGFYQIERAIEASGDLEIRAGSALQARWQVTALPDQPPQVLFRKAPMATARKALRVEYSLQDDYGVSGVTLEIRLANTLADEAEEGEIFELELAGAETRNEPVRRTFFADLTAHSWAGLTVEGRLLASDAIGQQGASAWTPFTLPERIFTHPVAKNLNFVRKGLLRNPERREGAARRLDIQARKPAEFQNDLAVFSALRFAAQRLRRADDSQSIGEVTGILWDAALHLEDGQTSVAERALRNAFDEAARMLENSNAAQDFDALAEQIARLMQEYLSNALSGAEPPSEMEMGAMQAMDSRSLDALLRQIRDLAAAGRSAEALELLNALRNMMENISPAPMSAEEYRRLMEGAQAMNELEDIRRRQADLKDRTVRQSLLQALKQRLGDSSTDLSVQAQEQGDLEGALDQVLGNLGAAGIEAPSALGKAAGSMAAARGDLEQNNAETAITAQGKALEALAEGIGELNRQLSNSLARMRAGSAGTDPLGRPSGLDNAHIPLPRESDMEAAQRMLQELRDRLSRTDRPQIELEYIRRLLRRF